MDVDRTQRSEEVSGGKQIALPFSDTPVINRNKEMRKKTGNRRSSVGMRGRRASSLMNSGHSAIPHREVVASEFYKHIESDGLTEPRRMKQLLTWCGERSLAEKPPLGSLNSNAILGGTNTTADSMDVVRSKNGPLTCHAYSPSDSGSATERFLVPLRVLGLVCARRGSRGTQATCHCQAKPAEYGTRRAYRYVGRADKKVRINIFVARVWFINPLFRLKLEKKKWQSLKRPAPEMPLLFDSPEPDTSQSLPDASLLDPDEAQILASLLGPSRAVADSSIPKTQSRLQELQNSLEFKIDRLEDNVHKIEQRMETAGRQADRVLGLSAARLKEREEREKTRAGTKEMPIMEVLRGLSKILPEGGGG